MGYVRLVPSGMKPALPARHPISGLNALISWTSAHDITPIFKIVSAAIDSKVLKNLLFSKASVERDRINLGYDANTLCYCIVQM